MPHLVLLLLALAWLLPAVAAGEDTVWLRGRGDKVWIERSPRATAPENDLRGYTDVEQLPRRGGAYIAPRVPVEDAQPAYRYRESVNLGEPGWRRYRESYSPRYDRYPYRDYSTYYRHRHHHYRHRHHYSRHHDGHSRHRASGSRAHSGRGGYTSRGGAYRRSR